MSGGKGGSKPAGNTTSTVTSQPWSGSLPYITDALSSAQNLYGQGGPQYYPGQTYAPENTAEQTGISNLQNQSQSGLSLGNSLENSSATNNPAYSFFQNLTSGSGADPGISTLQDYASGKYLTADNPYFSQMANTLTAQVLPGINAQFANAGRGVSGLASRAASEGLGDSIGNLAYQNYQQGLTQQQAAANSLAGYGITGAGDLSNLYQNNIANQLSGANLGLSSAAAGLAAGQTQQGFDQASITDAMNRYNYNQQLPYQTLQNYISEINALNPSGGTSTTTQPYFQNQTANTLGTALGGAGLISALGGIGDVGSAATTIGGVGIDGLAGTGILGSLSSLLPFLAA